MTRKSQHLLSPLHGAAGCCEQGESYAIDTCTRIPFPSAQWSGRWQVHRNTDQCRGPCAILFGGSRVRVAKDDRCVRLACTTACGGVRSGGMRCSEWRGGRPAAPTRRALERCPARCPRRRSLRPGPAATKRPSRGSAACAGRCGHEPNGKPPEGAWLRSVTHVIDWTAGLDVPAGRRVFHVAADALSCGSRNTEGVSRASRVQVWHQADARSVSARTYSRSLLTNFPPKREFCN